MLIGKPYEDRPFGIYKYRRKDNIKIGVQKICCDHMDWIHLTKLRTVAMEEANEISGSIRGGKYICYVAGLIPDDFIDFFSVNPFRCNMALGLTQPLTEMSTRNLSER
jgi:hypothetical protein